MKFFYSVLTIIILFVATPIKSQIDSGCTCTPIPTTGTEITVSNVQELESAIDQANINNGNTTIILEPGEYQLSYNLRLITENMANTTIMGSTDNKDDVYIKGLGWDNNLVTHIFLVEADNFTVANMTIGEVFYHPIQVQSNPIDADNFTAQNVKFLDAKEQLLKVSGGGGPLYSDNGKVLCCEFEFTNGIAYQYYTGGIDAHRAVDWEVKYNTFKHIRSPEYDLAEHAIHFWRECSGTIVESNLIINCDRGIGFGLGEGFENGHTGGLIMNNMVHTSRDVGIGLETSTDTKIYNNTVVTDNYPRSIEYRFAGTTDALITNNLVNGEISDRSSGSTGVLTTNYQFASTAIFTAADDYDYHLEGLPNWLVDQGSYLTEVKKDFDCEDRPVSDVSDIGADQAKLVSAIDQNQFQLEVSVYPNPSDGEIYVRGIENDCVLSVFTLLGKEQKSLIITNTNSKLDISELPAGNYYLKFVVDHQTQITKFTKI